MYYKLIALLRKERFGGIVVNSRGNILSFNHSGYKILSILQKEPMSIKEISDTYDIKEHIAPDEIIIFLERLKEEYMVEEIEQKVYDDMRKENTWKDIENDKDSLNFIRVPLIASLDITNMCNQHCLFCYTEETYLNGELSVLNDDNILKIVRILAEEKICFLNILGGEPTARFDTMCKIFELCEKEYPFLHCSFATNGTYGGGINKEQANRLNQFKNISIRFSINGYKEAHDSLVGLNGAFDKVIESLQIMKLYAPDLLLNVSCVMTRQLLQDLEKLLDLLICECGVRVVELMPLQIVGHATLNQMKPLNLEDFKKCVNKLEHLNEKYKHYNSVVHIGAKYIQHNIFKIANENIVCGIPTTVNITASGDCYFCHMTMNKKEFCGGNILKQDLSTIWNSKVHYQLLEKLNITNDNCLNCERYGFCNGGCKVGAFFYNNEWGSADPSCPYL